VNFYKLNFSFCMESNPSHLATEFFVSAEKSTAGLGPLPAFFENLKLVLGESGCTNLSSHYISIKRKDDDSYRKVIVGMRTLTPTTYNTSRYYFNIYTAMGVN
jgi:hypothetical protein